jgi:hypothetical protein
MTMPHLSSAPCPWCDVCCYSASRLPGRNTLLTPSPLHHLASTNAGLAVDPLDTGQVSDLLNSLAPFDPVGGCSRCWQPMATGHMLSSAAGTCDASFPVHD